MRSLEVGIEAFPIDRQTGEVREITFLDETDSVRVKGEKQIIKEEEE